MNEKQKRILEIEKQIKPLLEEYTAIQEEGIDFEITDERALHIWQKIKPYTEKQKPIMAKYEELFAQKGELQKQMDELDKEMEKLKTENDKLSLKVGKFINQVSPALISAFEKDMDYFQQLMNMHDDEDGKVYVKVQNWLAQYILGYKKKKEANQAKYKMTNAKIGAENPLTEK